MYCLINAFIYGGGRALRVTSLNQTRILASEGCHKTLARNNWPLTSSARISSTAVNAGLHPVRRLEASELIVVRSGLFNGCSAT